MMISYVLRRVSLLQCLCCVLLGFGLAVGNMLLGFICLLLSVLLDALNAFLIRRHEANATK